MTDETLQPEQATEVAPVNDTPVAADTTDTTDTPDTADGGQPEGTTDPASYTKAIHKKHYEMVQAQQETERLRQQLQLQQSQAPQVERPTIPNTPDPYDDNFDQQIKARDKAVQDAANFDAQQQMLYQQQQFQQQQQIYAVQQAVRERQVAFITRATKSGITEAELSTTIQTVDAYGGVGQQLSEFLLTDEMGPGITTFLAKNPDEILKVQGMSPLQGAIHLSTVLGPKAAAARKNTNPPPPANSLGGGGAPASQSGPKGATFE